MCILGWRQRGDKARSFNLGGQGTGKINGIGTALSVIYGFVHESYVYLDGGRTWRRACLGD